MTRRESRDTSERRNEIVEDERPPVMAGLAARWRRSNLVKMATLRKGDHPGEVISQKMPKKSFIQKKEGLLSGAL